LINEIRENIDENEYTIEYLTTEYEKIKEYIMIINVKDHFKYLHINYNNNLTDKYLIFIYDNIYEIILHLLFIYNNDCLTDEHSNYCYYNYKKIIDCDKSNKCYLLHPELYSYYELIKEDNIELFKTYITSLWKNSINNRKYIQIYNSDYYNYAIENIY
jgi:hypothetical protein